LGITQFDLHTFGNTYIMFPLDTSFCGHNLGDIARRISDHEDLDLAAPLLGAPAEPGDAGRVG
jgi:hypothetical protein